MATAQPNELAHLPQELQSHNDAQDLLLVCKLSHTQWTREATCASLQQTELLAGIISEQDRRAIRSHSGITFTLALQSKQRRRRVATRVVKNEKR